VNTILTLHDPERAREYYIEGVWQTDTMYSCLRDHAEARPDSWALRDGSVRLTWRDLASWVEAVAEDLHHAGVKRGQRVSIWLPNRVEAVVIFLACSRNGYVCNPSLHQNYTVGEIADLLRSIDAAALFAQTGYGADATQADIFAAACALPSMKRVYRLDPRGAERPAGATEAQFPDRAPVTASVPPITNPDKVVYLAFTSGTTGKPKGVMHSDNTLLANGRAMVRDWHHDERTVLVSLSPMSHHIGTVALEQMLVAGLELVMTDPTAGRKPFDWIVETGGTYVMGVPTHAIDLLADMRARGLDKLGRVKVFYMAGSPIPRETAQSFLDRGIVPQNVYGMTENGSHQYTLPKDNASTIVETCGRACHGYEVKIWKADRPDEEAGPGEVGEIGGRGAVLTLGYFGSQPATERSFNAHGWFMSGDLGRFDENGCLHIAGRKKDLIIRGGHNIHPSRIEDLAHRHPQVVKAAAFPIADDRLGERVCLAIIPAGGATPSAHELLRHLDKAGLSKYDMPEYFIAMEAFPLTASGKILKRELVEWAKTGRIVPASVRFKAGKAA
jgi:acyl-CoA synthetase